MEITELIEDDSYWNDLEARYVDGDLEIDDPGFFNDHLNYYGEYDG